MKDESLTSGEDGFSAGMLAVLPQDPRPLLGLWVPQLRRARCSGEQPGAEPWLETGHQVGTGWFWRATGPVLGQEQRLGQPPQP